MWCGCLHMRGVCFVFSSRRRHTSCVLVTGVQTCALPISDVRAQSVLALGPARAPLDLVLMDPPYGTGAGAVALDKLARLGWTGPGTWVSIETARDEELAITGFAIDASRVHGKARITLVRPIS